MKKASRKREVRSTASSQTPVLPSTWLVGLALLLAPLITGRLEVGTEPVEPSLRGVVAALFTGGTMLSVAVWLVALLVLIALVWEWRWAAPQPDAVPRSVRVFAVLLIVWLLVSAITSVYRWNTIVLWSWWALAMAGAWVLSQRRQTDGIAVQVSLAVAGTLVAALAVREYAESVHEAPNWRVFGTFFNPNFLAGYLCLTMPVTLALSLASAPSTSRSQHWLALFGAFLQMVAILLTGSRFGVFSAALALVVMAAWITLRRAWTAKSLALFGLFCFMSIAIAGLLARPLTQRVASAQVEAQEHSGGFRVWTWRGTLAMVEANPLFGTGLGTFEIAYPRYALVGFTRLAHNSYLQLAAEAGVPAVFLLVAALGTLAWAVLRREQNAPVAINEWDARVLRAGLVGATTAGLVRNLIDSDWSVFASLFTFWAVAGILLALSSELSSSASPARLKTLQGAHLILLALALIPLTLRMAGALSANRSNWNLSQGVFDEEGYRRALRWEPWNGDHALSLGLLYLSLARAGDTDRAHDAEKYLRASAALMPTSKTWYHLGNLYRDILHDDARAVEAYRRALYYDPNALRVMVELGATLERLGKLQEAKSVYRRMLQLEEGVYGRVRAVPEVPEVDYAFAYAGLARVARRENKHDEARRMYERALRILDADRAARENNPMAQAIARPPDRERAVDQLRRECMRALQKQG